MRLEYAARLEKLIEACEFRKGLRAILELAQRGNAYMNEKAPWKNPENAKNALYVLIQVVFSLAVISAPYLPFTAQRILDYMNLGRSVSDLSWDDVELEIPPGHRINEPKPLFRKITADEVREKLKKLEEIKLKK